MPAPGLRPRVPRPLAPSAWAQVVRSGQFAARYTSDPGLGRRRNAIPHKPNTRETIRHHTLHRFTDALLIVENPDQPDRPLNAPKWCYQIHPRAREAIRAVASSRFQAALTAYLADVPGLEARYEAAWAMDRISVPLSGGESLTLSPGSQNMLLNR